MILKVSDRIFVSSPSKNKVKVGSRIPDDNRDWLKRHGIVTDREISPAAFAPLKADFARSHNKALVFLAAFLVCLIPAALFFQQHELMRKFLFEQSQSKKLAALNQHLQQSLNQLSVVNQTQQLEMSRMASQLRGVTQSFHARLGNLVKGEAMYDALQQSYDGEISRLSTRYDQEVEALHKQVSHQDEMISSLEASIQSMDGVVVQANPLANGDGMTNSKISAINTEFQFVVIDSGSSKGAALGQMVEFYRQHLLVGYGEVEKVYPDFSGVRVFSSAVLSQLEKGDAAFLKTSSVEF